MWASFGVSLLVWRGEGRWGALALASVLIAYLLNENIIHVTLDCDGYEEKQVTCRWSCAASSFYQAPLTSAVS
jgi:hypothetical protein